MQVIKNILQSRIVWIAVGLGLFYVFLTHIVDYPQLAELLNGVRFALAALVVFAYLPVALEALTIPGSKLNNHHHLVLGICLSWSMIVFTSTWGAAGRYFDFEVGLADSMITGAASFYVILAAILHLTAPHAIAQTKGPSSHWKTVAVGVFVGLLIGFVLASAWWRASTSPDMPVRAAIFKT